MTGVDGAQELGLVQMKAFRLKSDITLYADSAQRPIINIKARQAIALNFVFDVSDAKTGQPIFALERKGLRSAFVRDHWTLFDTAGNQFGEVIETSSSLALLRRWIGARDVHHTHYRRTTTAHRQHHLQEEPVYR